MHYTRGVVGVDEVGRGAWAGPFVACALFVGDHDRRVRGVRDSNECSIGRRERFSVLLRMRHHYSLSIITVEELNVIGMARAQVAVFERAVEGLKKNILRALPQQGREVNNIGPRLRSGNTVLIDGRPLRSHPEWRAIIDGDRKEYAIAAASVIAKVERDAMMKKLHTLDPRYRFDLHKGYGTALHERLLTQHGPSIHHRRLFEPVAKMLYSLEANEHRSTR